MPGIVTGMKWLVSHTTDEKSMQRYLNWLAGQGVEGEPIGPGDRLPVSLKAFSALLLTGGGDVNPERYGEPAEASVDGINDDRDELEIQLVRLFIRRKKPVLGICRGIQLINVACGGKLVQNLSDEGRRRHTKKSGEPDKRHRLRWAWRSGMARELAHAGEANSAHHQAVRPDAVGRGLRVMARSSDGVIEALEGCLRGGWISAVQWHPERMEPPGHRAARGLLEYWKTLVQREGAAHA